ncbi:phosphate regulon sensor histidine kinase PhoR [Undibacterium flavidum]|uniref:histidine kinase n=1 Tax=Undibacterium flavidum TaxID=2762297 RepID=A0ABR6YGA9_9BURK|nr:phosphate regulon sensor histidine kinase PhoR [Undibacterium flavidum]MBC3875604.1 phosphate regulon sensor histidine kinase PhoR [Undibacterium flavidum]
MHPHLIFWISAAVRMAIILAAAAAGAYFWGVVTGLALALFGMIVLIVVQLQYLLNLSDWLDNPNSARLPDGWGAWTEIFSRLYKLRRGDEKNQTELAEWLARFRQAMTLLPDGLVIMDDVMFLEWCNPIAERHLGLDLTRDKGMRVTNLVRTPEFIDYIILGRYETPLTLSLRDRKLIVHVIPFENRRQILVTHDITESERIDMMRRDFIANASHELRTPLTVINGFLEIASMQPDMEVAIRSSHLKLMVEQGERMQRLVEDMLTLSRLESTEFKVRNEGIDMQMMLKHICQEAQALSAGKHRIELEFDGPDIMGSTDEIRSAISNLVTNAVRYTPEHGEIKVIWRNTSQGPQCVVQDNGIGISQEHLSRLTERFYRVDKSRSRETQGTGLGLAIVKHVLIRHGAQLLIESTVNVGSKFCVQFPARTLVTAA